jgi:hypothetical protein
MKTPEDKDRSSPPKPKGGRAAGRLEQFEMERGLIECPLPEVPEDEEADDKAPAPSPKKQKKPKA